MMSNVTSLSAAEEPVAQSSTTLSSDQTEKRGENFAAAGTSACELSAPCCKSEESLAHFDKEHSSERRKDTLSDKNHNSSESHIIPGVEHIFFEDEFEKMEQKSVIILAVDDGCHSEMAFRFYKDNVDRPGYYLHVVHHTDAWSHYKHTEEGPSASQCQEIAEKAKGEMDIVEKKYRDFMKQNNIEGDYFAVHGKDAWHDIIQHQEKTNAMMIVMGTRGAGALSRTFRGSVSDSVVHHASVPVLVCCHPKD